MKPGEQCFVTEAKQVSVKQIIYLLISALRCVALHLRLEAFLNLRFAYATENVVDTEYLYYIFLWLFNYEELKVRQGINSVEKISDFPKQILEFSSDFVL